MEGFYAKLARPDIPGGTIIPATSATARSHTPSPATAATTADLRPLPPTTPGLRRRAQAAGGTRVPRKTIAEVVAGYAPPNENNTQRYVALVCAWTGLAANTVIDGHLG